METETPGERLRRLRIEAGLSTRALAARADVIAAAVNELENGKKEFKTILLTEKLAAALGVTPSYLLYGK